MNERVFVNNASLGVYATVVQDGTYRGAKARTWVRLLPDLLGPTAAPLDLEFEGPDDQRYAGLPLVLVSNNPYRLTRLARTGGRPKLDTGIARHPRRAGARQPPVQQPARVVAGRLRGAVDGSGAGRAGRRGAGARPPAAIRLVAGGAAPSRPAACLGCLTRGCGGHGSSGATFRSSFGSQQDGRPRYAGTRRRSMAAADDAGARQTVGRESELELLDAALEAMAESGFVCVAVEGEPGIGKRGCSANCAIARKCGAALCWPGRRPSSSGISHSACGSTPLTHMSPRKS